MYRSPHTPSGIFNQLGTLHVHIDGAHDVRLVEYLVRKLEEDGHVGKMSHVLDSIAGPEREELKETYESHTPSMGSEEVFDFFSTSLLQSSTDVPKVVQQILDQLSAESNAVVELEQVWATMDSDGKWQECSRGEFVDLDSGIFSVPPLPSLSVEIHHAFDVPKRAGEKFPPFSLRHLMGGFTEMGISLGGLFLFEKPDHWAFRTNAFVKEKGVRELVELQWKWINVYLQQHGWILPVRTLVERVLGIWKSC